MESTPSCRAFQAAMHREGAMSKPFPTSLFFNEEDCDFPLCAWCLDNDMWEPKCRVWWSWRGGHVTRNVVSVTRCELCKRLQKAEEDVEMADFP